jgi:hypothetical protein
VPEVVVHHGCQEEGVEVRDTLGGGRGEVEDKTGVEGVREGRKGKCLVLWQGVLEDQEKLQSIWYLVDT